MNFYYPYHTTDCRLSYPVGVADDTKVLNDQMTASSYFQTSNHLPPWYGRLNNEGLYWAAASVSPSDPWIEVDFLKLISVMGIIIQGGINESWTEWVKTLQVQYGIAKNSLVYVLEDGNPKVSTDSNTNTFTRICNQHSTCNRDNK